MKELKVSLLEQQLPERSMWDGVSSRAMLHSFKHGC